MNMLEESKIEQEAADGLSKIANKLKGKERDLEFSLTWVTAEQMKGVLTSFAADPRNSRRNNLARQILQLSLVALQP